MNSLRQAVGCGVLLGLAAGALQAASPARVHLVEGYGRRPLAFQENRGQTAAPVRFLSRGSGYDLFLTGAEAVVALRQGSVARTLRLRWVGATAAPGIAGERELAGRTNYLVGERSAWRTGIPSFERVRYRGLYPAIDLVFYGNGGQLEYDFELAPGADPRAVRLAVQGADRVEVEPTGDLALHLGGGVVHLRKPVSYQEAGGRRQEVASAYRLHDNGEIGFALAAYDAGRPLVIDPVLAYSTYLGGGGIDLGNAIAVDAPGNVYLTGETTSPDFPLLSDLPPPPEDENHSFQEIFVTKLDRHGALVYSTMIGGSDFDASLGLAVDRQGAVYVTGTTTSPNFPLVNPIPHPPDEGLGDAFVLKLDAAGSALLYSTTFGGTDHADSGAGVAVDARGHAFVAGFTFSETFPAAHTLPPRPGPFFGEAFVVELSAAGSALLRSVQLGGSEQDSALAIALDARGQVYVGGFTTSPDFPAVHAVQGSYGGGQDGFVAKLDLAGPALVYSTFLGGGSTDAVSSLATGPAGRTWVTGTTSSADFPTAQALQPALAGESDAFVARLDPAGALVYSTFLGGGGGEIGAGIAVDGSGRAYVTGLTRSTSFPLADPLQAACAPLTAPGRCVDDAFVAGLNPAGSALVFSTFLGGTQGSGRSAVDQGRGIAADARGNLYVTGFTQAVDFPVVNALQGALQGSEPDAFVAKIAAGNRAPD